MVDVRYNKDCFIYDPEIRTFFAYRSDLHTEWSTEAFPNRRRKFYICNTRTGNYRRFLFHRETRKHYSFKFIDIDANIDVEEYTCIILKYKKKPNVLRNLPSTSIDHNSGSNTVNNISV